MVREWPLVGRVEERSVLVEILTNGRGLVIGGHTGVGKSRLAGAVLDDLAERGYTVERITATRSASTVPFGALAPLLPPRDDADHGIAAGPLAMARLRHDLLDRAGEVGLVIGVDDAHCLDDASAALLHQLATSTRILLVCTVRDGERRPDAVTALWKQDLVERVDLQPLSRAELEALVKVALGAPVDEFVALELARVSGGNCLYLRELISAARTRGRLRVDGDRWVLDGSLPTSAKLGELVDERVGELPEATRSVVELVALGQPLSLALLERLTDPAAIEDAARRELLDIEEDRRRATVVLTHPLYGEVALGRMSALRTRGLRRALADAIEATGMRRGDDLARFVALRVDAGLSAAPWQLLHAAQRGINAGDTVTGEALAREATSVLRAKPDDDDDGRALADAELVLADALTRQGRGAEALALLDGMSLPDDPDLRHRHTDWRALVRYLLDGDVDAAVDTLAAAGAQADAGIAADMLAVARAQVLAASSRIDDALVVLDEMEPPGESGALRLRWLETYAPALLLSGRLTEAERMADEAMAQATEEIGHESGAALWPRLIWVATAVGRGELDEAATICAALLERARVLRDVEFNRTVSVTFGFVRYHQGRLDEAAELLRTGLADIPVYDPIRVRLLAFGTLACVLIDGGRSDEADKLLALAEDEEADTPFAYALTAARALRAHSEGLGTIARDLLVDGFERTARIGDQLGTALLGLVGVRIDQVAVTITALEPLVENRPDAGIGLVLLGYARALEAGDSEALEASSLAFESAGMLLLAAEAAARAANHARPGDTRSEQRARARAARLYARCPGAVPVGTEAEVPLHLTGRELEIARLAARGRTSPEIAAKLSVSTRTVESHLGRVYFKLGVSGRAELAEVDGLG